MDKRMAGGISPGTVSIDRYYRRSIASAIEYAPIEEVPNSRLPLRSQSLVVLSEYVTASIDDDLRPILKTHKELDRR